MKYKRKPIYIPNEVYGLTNWVPSLNASFTDIKTNSWFDIKVSCNPFQSLEIEQDTETAVIPKELYDQQMKTIRRRKLDKVPVFIYTKTIRLYPTDEQKIIFHEWFMATTRMYNITVNFIRQGIFLNNRLIQLNSAYNYLYENDFRYILKDNRDNIISKMQYRIPVHIMDEMIAQVVSNYKTCISNLRNGNIIKFKIKCWSYNRRKFILKLESSYFVNGTFCSRTFKNIQSSSPLTGIERTCTLQYNKDTGKYLLYIPSSMESHERLSNDMDGGVDLGVRSFASSYSKNDVVSIANDPYKDFKKLHKKIDKINELLQIPAGQENFVVNKIVVKKEIVVNNKKKIIKIKKEKIVPKKINRQSLKRALRKYHLRIKNKVKDLHYKASHYLVHHYDRIYIGKLNTKSILSKNNKKITKKTKRIVGVLSPYLFRQRLKYMGNKYGTFVYYTNEYLTTVTCPNCGRINKIGRNKIHQCQCGMITDRDFASGKNILKVGYKSENDHDNDLDIHDIHNENVHVVYSRRTKDYEVIEV